MKEFFESEAGHIVIAIFLLVVTAIVTTRKFMLGVAFKRGTLLVGSVLIAAILFHTTSQCRECK